MTLQVLKAQPTNPQLTNPLAGEMAAVLDELSHGIGPNAAWAGG